MYNLVGHPFKLGNNPRVDAQFSVRYCIASALLRKNSRLQNFDVDAVKDPEIDGLISKIQIISDPELENNRDSAVEMDVITGKGVIHKTMDIPRGYPEKHLN
jgi:2-methylcitrate dehydratase PrpD